jgi:hypothetical protein
LRIDGKQVKKPAKPYKYRACGKSGNGERVFYYLIIARIDNRPEIFLELPAIM